MATYNYSIENDTLNGAVNSGNLADEIEASSIAITWLGIEVSGDDLDIEFDASLSTQEKTDLDAIVAAHTGEIEVEQATVIDFPSSQKDAAGRAQFSMQKPSGISFDSVSSHDFTDRTTWFTNSVRVTGETLTTNGLEYSSINPYWIDLEHGKHAKEDEVSAPYVPVIYDGGVEVTSGFAINYDTGKVTFDSAPGGAVTADYSYSPDTSYRSAWTIAPSAGKVLKLEHAELDFTIDVTFDIVDFEIWVYNPYDPPNKVMYTRTTYKNFKDILKIANTVEVIPALQGITNDTLRAVFDYTSTINLDSSVGAELRIVLRNDTPMTGEFGTITLYTIEEDI